MKTLLGVALIAVVLAESPTGLDLAGGGQDPTNAGPEFTAVADWPTLPRNRSRIGPMHGDVAVSSNGDVYVSVEDPTAALQVYVPDGTFVRNVPNAPSDLHGFVIRRQPDGEFIFGASLLGQRIVKMSLDGKVVMTIPGSVVPDHFKNPRENYLKFLTFLLPADDPRRTSGHITDGGDKVLLTGVDVAPNGDLYVVDGYASDFIHRFDRGGKYLTSFGGKQGPYSFRTLHKIAIDNRFQPARIIGCDRANGRIVHLSLDGEFLGVVASDLLLPAAVAISGDHAVVGELGGRVTILDKAGSVVARLGANTEAGVGTNKIPPEQWRTGFMLAPHGVAVNQRGDILASEFSAFGRVHLFTRR